MRRASLNRLVMLVVIMLAPWWAGLAGTAVTPIDRGMNTLARQHSFNLVEWSAIAITELAWSALFPSEGVGVDLNSEVTQVQRYFDLSGELVSLRAEYDRLVVREDIPGRDVRLVELRQELAFTSAERAALVEVVESVISRQMNEALAEQNIRRQTIKVRLVEHPPFVELEINPSVAFKLNSAPQLLVVAPRDRVELIGSLLLQPDLTLPEVEGLEIAVEQLEVASLVTKIGGLATYPSIIPETNSLRRALSVIGHEWAHHYLFFRPLGWNYFADYEMRTINETVADIVGEELADTVWNRYYAPPSAVRPDEQPPSLPAERIEPTFGDLMREIRVEVERYLADGDVVGAEEYMSERRAWLSDKGYYVRRLNTAYLSFYGAYAGTDNPYEARLRRLRQRSGSLQEFLLVVGSVDSVESFERVVGH